MKILFIGVDEKDCRDLFVQLKIQAEFSYIPADYVRIVGNAAEKAPDMIAFHPALSENTVLFIVKELRSAYIHTPIVIFTNAVSSRLCQQAMLFHVEMVLAPQDTRLFAAVLEKISSQLEDGRHLRDSILQYRYAMIHQFWINLLVTQTQKNPEVVRKHGSLLGIKVDMDIGYRPLLLTIVSGKKFDRWDEENIMTKIEKAFRCSLPQTVLRTALREIPITYLNDNQLIVLCPEMSASAASDTVLKWLKRQERLFGYTAVCCIGRQLNFFEVGNEYPYLIETASGQTKNQKISWTDPEDEKESFLVQYIRRYVQQNIDHAVTRKELSKVLYLSESYISHMWIKETGDSLKNYLVHQRMQTAKRLLKETDLSVGEIADRVGYADFSYFSRAFKREIGVPPSDYRKSWVGSRELMEQKGGKVL